MTLLPTKLSGADDPEAVMSFGDHLDELRRRVILAMVVPLPVAIVLFFVSDTLLRWMMLPVLRVLAAEGLPARLQALSPPEVLVIKLKLSVIAAIVLCIPWVIWQLWQFIRPGLYHHERRFVYFLWPGSLILTLLGAALMYFVMLPLMLNVLVAVGLISGSSLDSAAARTIESIETVEVRLEAPEHPQAGDAWLLWPAQELFVAVAAAQADSVVIVPIPRSIEQQYRLSWYINFVLLLFLAIVAAFQLPIALLLLGWLGLVTPQDLARQRRYAALICGIVAAVITPADVASMIIMLIPLYGLFELGLMLMRLLPADRVAGQAR